MTHNVCLSSEMLSFTSFTTAYHRKTRPERRYRVLTVTLCIGNTGRLHFPMNYQAFRIITQQAFIVRHWFKRSRIPEQIRNRTVPIIVRNRLNFLSIDEEHHLLEIPNTERDEWTNGVDTGRFTPSLKASFPVYGVVSCTIMQIKLSSCNVDSFINGCLGEQITP